MTSLAFILSQPRSGSTVLTAILDKRKGVVCMPESSFPQVLGTLQPGERNDPKWLAAFYLGATFPPTPLTFADAEACMNGDDEAILVSLGVAVARKLGRNPEDVTAVIWKTTRTIGMHKGPKNTPGKFIALRRHPHNVFESQSRFEYGVRNRNPLRYSVFAQSYEHALARTPRERTFDLEYDQLPGILPELFAFLGVPDCGEWESGESSLELVAKSRSWLSQINDEFKNTDPEKRTRISRVERAKLMLSLGITRPLRPFMGPLRAWFDRRTLGHIRERAMAYYLETGHGPREGLADAGS